MSSCIIFCHSRLNNPIAHKQNVSNTTFPLCQAVLYVSSHNWQYVSVTTLFLCQAASSIMFLPMTNSMWVTKFNVFLCQAVPPTMSHPMTNRMWVTLLHFFAWQFHQSCLIDQQNVSDTALFLCLVTIMSYPITNSLWVTPLFLCQAASSIMSHHMTNLNSKSVMMLHCQAVSSIMSHSMTNSMWVALPYFFARQSHYSCLITWPTVCEWYSIYLPGSLIPWQIHRMWVTLL